MVTKTIIILAFAAIIVHMCIEIECKKHEVSRISIVSIHL